LHYSLVSSEKLSSLNVDDFILLVSQIQPVFAKWFRGTKRQQENYVYNLTGCDCPAADLRVMWNH